MFRVVPSAATNSLLLTLKVLRSNKNIFKIVHG